MKNKINLTEACENYFPFSTRRYRQLAEKGLCPKPEKNFIDYLEASKCIMKHQQDLMQSGDSPGLTVERTRQAKFAADKKEIEVEKMRGELIETSIAMKLWGHVIMTIKSKLLSIPVKLAPLALACKSMPEAKTVIETLIHEVLTEIANPNIKEISRMDSNNRDINNVPATTKPKSKRVGRPKSKVVKRK